MSSRSTRSPGGLLARRERWAGAGLDARSQAHDAARTVAKDGAAVVPVTTGAEAVGAGRDRVLVSRRGRRVAELPDREQAEGLVPSGAAEGVEWATRVRGGSPDTDVGTMASSRGAAVPAADVRRGASADWISPFGTWTRTAPILAAIAVVVWVLQSGFTTTSSVEHIVTISAVLGIVPLREAFALVVPLPIEFAAPADGQASVLRRASVPKLVKADHCLSETRVLQELHEVGALT